MKVLITGHTKGIGKSTYDLLVSLGYDVVGYSRSNGFDITNTDKIVNAISKEDPGIFINNAYANKAQTEVLKGVYELWKRKEKTIINICSAAALIPQNHPDYEMPYVSDKRSQREFCERVNFEYSKSKFLDIRCRLTNLNFDYVKTNFKSKHDKRKFPNLRPSEVAEVIVSVIDSKVCIREISFHSTQPPEIVE